MSSLSGREEETETSRTMAGHFQDLHFSSEKIARRRRFNQEIGLYWFDFQLKAEVAEEIGIGDHRHGFRMTTDGAVEAPFYLRHIRDVIEMPVREQEHLRLNSARLSHSQAPSGASKRIDPSGAWKR